MRCLHLQVSADNLAATKPDYAKSELDCRRVSFATACGTSS